MDELLYKEVLEGRFKDREARSLFRSQAVVGQPITPVESFTVRSLITLQQRASYDKRSDAAITGLPHHLGSLLSIRRPVR